MLIFSYVTTLCGTTVTVYNIIFDTDVICIRTLQSHCAHMRGMACCVSIVIAVCMYITALKIIHIAVNVIDKMSSWHASCMQI